MGASSGENWICCASCHRFWQSWPEREKRVHYVFDIGEERYWEAVVAANGPVRSIVPELPAAAWYERELHDQYGIEITGHPDLRPLVFHENWPDDVHPMVDAANQVPWASNGVQVPYGAG